MPLAQQLLGASVGANLPAAVMATTWEEELRSRSAVLGCRGPIAAAAMAEIPGPLNAPWNRPDALAIELGAALLPQVRRGIALAEVLAIGKGLPAAHHLQVHI